MALEVLEAVQPRLRRSRSSRYPRAVIQSARPAHAEQRDWVGTARTLSEALPYLQRYDGAIIVIKLGGHAMTHSASLDRFARDLVLMKQCNVHPVVVHGGGPQINQMLERLAIKSTFIDGKRVTDGSTIQVVEMVLSGTINKSIVQAINGQGGRAVGLSGKDGRLIVCDPDDPKLGFVGRPVEVSPEILSSLIEQEFIPVVAPIGMGKNGETFNINGDTVAGTLAGALKADRLLLLTDVAGVQDNAGDVMTQLTPERIKSLILDGVIAGGMIPKTKTALGAIAGGVGAVVILDGRVQHSCLLELFTEYGIGSLIQNRRARHAFKCESICAPGTKVR